MAAKVVAKMIQIPDSINIPDLEEGTEEDKQAIRVLLANAALKDSPQVLSQITKRAVKKLMMM